MFENAVLPGGMGRASRLSFAVSLTAQTALATCVLLASLWYSDSLPKLTRTTPLMAPPLPPPPVMPQQVSHARAATSAITVPQVARVFRLAPVAPRTVMPLSNVIEPAPDVVFSGAGPISVPNGTGKEMGVINGVLPPPPPPKPVVEVKKAPQKQMRVSEGVLAGMLVKRVMPVYPPLAKAARIQGTVVLQGVVGRDGRIHELQVISGHPLLTQAALDAVRQWVYRPTLLSGEPVEVAAPIEVHFTLAQ